ncbi:non-ribosomal peptide synthetase [Amycolatopsis aidingensis]|uniref:non-ribosomal peptide synthetase n=1 Tax=Amycolatopsis aidingensis TaxID=2842453 RepID=UPI001C0C4B10|nr:amino acid adenylation domain-containing protein [Amycolatopsis aidingensis]
MNPSDEAFVFPASSGQRRLWLLDQLMPGTSVYNIGWRIAVDGPVDPAALRAALAGLVRRHEALRTHFAAEEGTPVQVVTAAAGIELPHYERATPAEVDALVDDLARQPFDLHTGPLLRAALASLSPTRHVLVLVLHHSIADGWSCGVLFDELATLYSGAEPPEVSVQYPDYALWQQEQVDGGAFAADLAYWSEALRGAPTVLRLPADHTRPGPASGAGAELRAALPAKRVPGGFAALLATFQSVLYRVTGQEDFLVATPAAARTRPETDRLVGFVANTLPLRAVFTQETTLGQARAAAEAATVAAIAHQDLPFEQLVDLAAPERSLSHAPLVQVMFAVEPPPEPRTAGEVTFAPEPVAGGGSKFAISLTVEQAGEDWSGRWQYDPELFDADTIVALHTAFAAALGAEDATPVAELPLGGQQRPRATQAPPPPRPTAAELVRAALAARPDSVLLDDRFTAAELDRASDRLAHALLAAGARPDEPVALLVPRGAPTIVGIIAAWKAGAGYLPLDPSWPPARLAVMAADACAPVLVAGQETRGLLPGPWTEVLVDATGEVQSGQWQGTPPVAVPQHPGSLAYLLYTSGSTGRPKGVRVTQGGLAALLHAMDGLLGLCPQDRIASISTPAFDVSTVEMLLPLLCGAHVTVLPAEDVADGALLRERIRTTGATVVQGGPSSWRLILAAGGVPQGVRLRVTGGEALTRDLADALQSDGAVLIDGYGPTETTVYSAAGVVPQAPAPVRLGPPVPGTELHVLDRLLRPVPPCVIGELHIGGAGVARGYHGMPGLTADRFRPNPFGPGRLYATGDLVRPRADGTLEFLGRADHQVKLRGFRIELGEIEAVLREHDDVADAVVTTWSAGDSDVRLVAYAVPRAGGTGQDATRRLWDQLRPHLARKLPDYMVPATMVLLESMPRTPTGKTDRSALPEPVWTGTAATVARAPNPRPSWPGSGARCWPSRPRSS